MSPRSVRRPDVYFKKTPEELSYRLSAPSQLAGSIDQVIETVERHVSEEQIQIASNLAAEGRKVLGAKAVCKRDPFDSPATQRPTRTVNPHLAAGGDSKALSVAKEALKTFRLAYREAWQTFKTTASAVFPGGTWLMRLRFGQPCKPLDPWWCVLAT